MGENMRSGSGGGVEPPAGAGGAVRARLLLAVAIGSALEWFNYATFAQLGPYFAPSFFPASSPAAQQLGFWGAYAVAFVAQPAGALLFGHFGDRHSRKASLLASIALMGVPTLLLGCLPTYAMIGWAAPALLMLLRVMQGVAVGGESGMASVWMYEAAPRERRGLATSLNMVGTSVGAVLGLIATLLLTALLTKEQMTVWGWRLAFLFGGATAGIGLLLRRDMSDPAVFLARKQQVQTKLYIEALESGTLRRKPSGPVARAATAALLRAARGPSAGPRRAASASAALSGARVAPASADFPVAPTEPLPALPAAAAPGALSGGACLTHPPAPAAGKPSAAPAACGDEAGFAVEDVGYSPILLVMRRHWSSVLLQVLWTSWTAIVFSVYLAWLPVYMATNVPGVSHQVSIGLTMANAAVIVLSSCASAWLSDRGMPRMPAAAAASLLSAAAAAPAAILSARGAAAAFAVQTLYLALAGWVGGLLVPVLATQYPTEARASGYNFTVQLVFGPLGGATPLAVQALGARLGPYMGAAPLVGGSALVAAGASAYMYFKRPEANITPPEEELWEKPLEV